MTVFISVPERWKNDLGAPFRDRLAPKVRGIIVSDEPLIGGAYDPDAKVDAHLLTSGAVVVFATGDIHDEDERFTRPNIADEIARARSRPWLRGRVIVLKERGVLLPSNTNPAYEHLDPDRPSRAFWRALRQLKAWGFDVNVPEDEPPAGSTVDEHAGVRRRRVADIGGSQPRRRTGLAAHVAGLPRLSPAVVLLSALVMGGLLAARGLLGQTPSASGLGPSHSGLATPTLSPFPTGVTTLALRGASNPRMSADGRVLLYDTNGDGHGSYEVWTKHIPGGVATFLIQGFMPSVALSPDGKLFAVVDKGDEPIQGFPRSRGFYVGEVSPTVFESSASGMTPSLVTILPNGTQADTPFLDLHQGSLTDQGAVAFEWGSSEDPGSLFVAKSDVIGASARYERLITHDDGLWTFGVSISVNGAWVAFDTSQSLPGFATSREVRNIHRIEVATKTVSLVTKGFNGQSANGDSYFASVANDGTVVYQSGASNLVAVDANAHRDIFATKVDGSTRLLIHAMDERQADGDSSGPAISADGRFAVFTSSATNLASNDGNDEDDVFRVRIADGATQCVSQTVDGSSGDGPSWNGVISGDGSVVAFTSDATDLGAGPDDHFAGVFVASFTEATR